MLRMAQNFKEYTLINNNGNSILKNHKFLNFCFDHVTETMQRACGKAVSSTAHKIIMASKKRAKSHLQSIRSKNKSQSVTIIPGPLKINEDEFEDDEPTVIFLFILKH